MEEKQVSKWLRRQFSVVGWALIIYNVLMNILVIGTMAADAAGQYLKGFAAGNLFPEMDMDALMNNASGYILAIFLGLLILWPGRAGITDGRFSTRKRP